MSTEVIDEKLDANDEKIKSSYTNKPLPDNVVKELENVLNLSSLTELTSKDFRRCLRSINQTVMQKYEGNSKYSKFFKPGNNNLFIDAKSLKRYFDGQPIRQDKLFVFLCFLNYTPERLSA